MKEPASLRKGRKARERRLWERQRLQIAMYIATSTEERPALYDVMRGFGMRQGTLAGHLVELVHMGVIVRDPYVAGSHMGRNLRVLPGWKERVLDGTR